MNTRHDDQYLWVQFRVKLQRLLAECAWYVVTGACLGSVGAIAMHMARSA